MSPQGGRGAGCWAGALALGLLLATAGPARAEPWLAPGFSGSSAEVVRDDEAVYSQPSPDAKRRGSARLGARLPIFGSKAAPGCKGAWLWVGAFAWLCDDRVRRSDWPFDSANATPSFADGLPYRYHFVGAQGSFGYATLERADDDVPARQFEPGFSIAVVRFEPKPGTGETFALTSHGLWVPLRDLAPANPSPFMGVLLAEGEPLPAWVAGEGVPALDRNGKKTGEVLPPFARVQPGTELKLRGKRYFTTTSGALAAQEAVRVATRSQAPTGLLPGERWIDVNVASQTLVAYEGERAVFATLVSTGRGREGSEEATPPGEFRIWVKLLSTDMTNLEDEEANTYYAIEDVPWVMFFKDGYGLHGAFWHRSFGNRRSHGCVNLSPLDAQWLFRWASPRLPSGFRAVHPTEYDLGTRVVVH